MKKAIQITICMLLLMNAWLFPVMAAAAANTASVLESPAQLTAAPGNNQVVLTWNTVTGAVSYKLKRSTVNGGPYDTTVAAGVTGTAYTDTSAVNGTAYYYVVTAVNSAAESMISNQAKAVPYAPIAGAPPVPADFAATARDGSVDLTWSASAGAASYTVKRSSASGGAYTTVGSALASTSFTDTTVVNGNAYYYVVSAANAGGESPNAEALIAVPAPVITVAQDGSGDFANIKEAIASIPAANASRKVIYIKAGVYHEKLSITVPYVSLVGAGRDQTKIVYDDNETTVNPANPGVKLQPLETATVSVGSSASPANQFSAANLTIENSSAASKGRALAALVVSDQVVFENVRFAGYQDTLYAGVAYNTKKGRQYYRNCEIIGRTDYIYGPATAAVFDHVDAVSINSADAADSGGYVTAASTQNPGGDVPGLVFVNSRLLKDGTTKGKHYLGRTWQDQPTVRFINTEMGDHIHPEGWTTMSEPLSTYYLSEYNSTGPGASPSKRQMGMQMTAGQASALTIPRMFDGWDPAQTAAIPQKSGSVAPIVDPALPDGQAGSYTKPVTVYMEVNGGLPEAGRVQYRINGGPWTAYTAEFAVGQAGANVIEYRYVDSSGTAAASKTLTFAIDPREAAKVPAFPGAEGGGMYVKGGRGGTVYVVSNLNDYAADEAPIPGSLRDAVSAGNRTIVFSTSGTIQLKRELAITQSHITIAGQTAPGDGIAIGGYMVKIGNNDTGTDIIVRYIRFRNGTNSLSDSVDITGDNVIMDHCSLSWSTDEAFSAKNRKNFTLQRSFISNSLNHSIHTKGPHGYGGIWGGTNATYTHNLIMNHTSRNVRFDRATDPDNYPTKVDYRSNVIYNWGFNSAYGGEQATGINMINNYYKPGPNTFDGVKSRIVNPSAGDGGGGGTFYIDGNYVEGAPDVTADNWVPATGGKYAWKAINPDQSFTRKYKPIVIPDAKDPVGGAVTTDSAEAAYEKVLQSGGASLPKRDSLDARLVNEVKNGTGRTVNTIASDGGLPEMNSLPTPVDSDGDGIPDAWESTHGLDPNNSADGAFTSSSGYTNLELYLNSLVVTPPPNPNAAIVSPVMHQAFTAGSAIPVTASASAAAGGAAIAKVIFYDGDQKIGEAAAAPYTFTWANASEGQHYLYAKAVDANGVMTLSYAAVIYVNGPNNVAPWTTQDIGQVSIPGAASLSGTTYTVKGSGKIGSSSDAFQYVYQTVEGNFEMVANVDFASEIDEDAKAGFMIRDSLDPASKAAALVLSTDPTDDFSVDTSGRKISFLNRSENGGSYKESLIRGASLKAPFWLKIVRDQNTIYGYESKDKANWLLVGSAAVSFSDKVYVGMAVDAPKSTSNIDYVTAATFADAKFTRSALFTLSNPASETVDIPAYTIKAHAMDRAQFSVTNNGAAVTDAVYVEAGADFSAAITLTEGVNTIVVSARNSELFGDAVNAKTITVTYNKSAVVFTPSAELPDAVTSSAFVLTGSVNRNAAVTVRLNGTTVLDHSAKLAAVPFEIPLVLQEGVNEIVVSGVDDYGNTGSKTYRITYNKNWGAGVFTVKSLILSDLGGNALSGLTRSTDTVADVLVYNNSSVSQSGTLVIALFDQQDRMVRYSLLAHSILPGKTAHLKALLKLPDIVMGCKLKAFVWDSALSQTLISNVVAMP